MVSSILSMLLPLVIFFTLIPAIVALPVFFFFITLHVAITAAAKLNPCYYPHLEKCSHIATILTSKHGFKNTFLSPLEVRGGGLQTGGVMGGWVRWNNLFPFCYYRHFNKPQ
jgi:hypothetical protein